jgi:hypothetical protein
LTKRESREIKPSGLPPGRMRVNLRTELISPPFNPGPTFFIVSRINPDLVIAADPIPILIVGGDPDVLPPFRDPSPVYFPMARRLAYYRWSMMNGSSIIAMVRGDDGRRMTILEQIVKGHCSQPDGHALPPSPDPIICKGKGY